MIVVTCSAPYGSGGLGRALQNVVEPLRRAGAHVHVFAGGIGPGDRAVASRVAPRLPVLLAQFPPVRFNPSSKQFLVFEHFDRAVAKRMRTVPDVTIAFCGQAMHTFRRARKLGCPRLELVAPTSHLRHVWRQHRLAERRYPIEGDWLSRAHLDKGLAEYDMADVIHVASDYARDSFLREGVPAAKLRRSPIAADARFTPALTADRPHDDVFRVVYTGALTVVKGVPLLLDAFAALGHDRAELMLVGGTGTRGMRQFVDQRRGRDPRIRITLGDPLPHLQRADVYVHPSYQDGFSYAVAEAIACRVPVIVTEDTGAKELIAGDVNGQVVPTDSVEAIRVALDRTLHAPPS